MKALLKQGLAGLRLDRALRAIYGGRGAVLMFHRLRPRDPSLSFPQAYLSDVDPVDFERILDALDDDGIDILSLDEAARRLRGERRGRFVCLTFDDGYRDNHDCLLPILRARYVPATVYVTTGLVDRTAALWWYALDTIVSGANEIRLDVAGLRALPARTFAEKVAAFNAVHDRLLASDQPRRMALLDELTGRYAIDWPALADCHMMTWEMVRTLADSGLVEVGGHTMTHPALAALDETDARREIAGSKEVLGAALGRPVRHFAFPFGTPTTTGAREVRIARELGIDTAVTTRPGALFAQHATVPHAWPRFGVGPFDGPASVRLRMSGLGVAHRHPWRPIVTDPVQVGIPY